ncbi:hypothetical protein B5K06_32770 [Rhizobium grahamii]|uniref:Uncharacterized protein n=1 Tax=Rhizobium grahamii TaxID=1120045 RepID=A0A370KEG4_9HYPH|nr:hypothetical protein B5K06_32770 [Rhizobium grahamii]
MLAGILQHLWVFLPHSVRLFGHSFVRLSTMDSELVVKATDFKHTKCKKGKMSRIRAALA